MYRPVPLITIIALLGLPPLQVSAAAAEPTRPEYVKTAEPICKANTLASQKILKGIRDDVRERKLKLAGAKFRRAARALSRTISQLENIPKPGPDEARLERWFTHLKGEVELLEKVAGRLRDGTTANVGKIVLELRHNANVTNNIVLTFGFEYCLIQPARYV
jgi:hypothetical protein